MSDLIERARFLRPIIEAAAQSLSDEQAMTAPELFHEWEPNSHAYEPGHKVRYEGVVFKVLQSHMSQPDWIPGNAPSLFARVLNPDPNIIPEWEQPDSTNAYMRHDLVRHNASTWESLVDNNVWEPGTTGTELLWQQLVGEPVGDTPSEDDIPQNDPTVTEPEDNGADVTEPEGNNPAATEPEENDPADVVNGDDEPTAEEPGTEEYPEWVQPTGAHDAYNTGDVVIYNGTLYVCTIDANVYAPGVYGWNAA